MSDPLGSRSETTIPDHTGWIVLALLAALCLLIFPNWLHAHSQGRLFRCKENLKHLAVALEMYSSDNHGEYPRSLDQLTRGPAYLRELPTCPADRGVAYGYRVSTRPDCFSLRCEGVHHEQAPRLPTESLLIDHP